MLTEHHNTTTLSYPKTRLSLFHKTSLVPRLSPQKWGVERAWGRGYHKTRQNCQLTEIMSHSLTNCSGQ